MLQPLSDRFRSWRRGAGRPNKYTTAKTINPIQFNGYFYVWFHCFLPCSLQAMCALDRISIATCAGKENLSLHLAIAAVKVACKLKTVSTVCCRCKSGFQKFGQTILYIGLKIMTGNLLVLLHTCQRYPIMVAHCFNFPVQCSLLNFQVILIIFSRSSQKLGGLSSGGS